MCWMTLPEVHPIAHKTSCPEYFKCKQIELIIHVGIYACAYLLYRKEIVHFSWDYVTTASSYIAGYLSKAIWNLRNLWKAIFCPAQICSKILSMFFVENYENSETRYFVCEASPFSCYKLEYLDNMIYIKIRRYYWRI